MKLLMLQLSYISQTSQVHLGFLRWWRISYSKTQYSSCNYLGNATAHVDNFFKSHEKIDPGLAK